MKFRYFFLCLLLLATNVSAQDIITKADGSKIDAKIEEITESVIRYRRVNNPNGPLYSISISNVVSVLFENGTTEKFTQTQLPTSSGGQTINNPRTFSDYQLLNMNTNYNEPQELYDKAKKYRLTGWIGGGTFLAVGLAVGIWGWSYDGGYNGMVNFFICAGTGIGVASIWWLGFHFGANSLVRKARQTEMYSSTILEEEVLRFGNNTLKLGLNAMGNQINHTHGLGLSLSLIF